MPIFLDRHDAPNDVDAKHVAEMHVEDIKLQSKYDCKGLTYWFDENTKKGFCLFEAPNEEAINNLHHHAHGNIPTTIIEVDENMVKSFLGRVSDTDKNTNATLNIFDNSAFRTVFILKLYPNSLNDSIFENHRNTMEELNLTMIKSIENSEGSVVKANLEYYLISFKSVTKAIDYAKFINSKLRNNKNFNKYFTCKVGLHCGEPVTHADELFGKVILFANRICDYVEGNLIVSSAVKNIFFKEKIKNESDINSVRFLNTEEENCLNQLADFLDKNWTNPNLKLESFCLNMGFSKSKLYRKVKSLTGNSLNHIIKEFRLRKALVILRDQKNNISEIAYATGFTSPAYFSRCFKAYYGILPSEYQ